MLSISDPPAADWYRRRRVRKARGWREIAEPAPWLETIQRQILRDVLDKIDPGPYAHGFVRGRSTATYAAPHCRKAVVLRFDIADFFANVQHKAVLDVFKTDALLIYPLHVMRYCLDPLNTTGRGLPQGAATSPALANLTARKLDVRLAQLGEAHGMAYTRYADDLTFSGDLGEVAPFGERVRELVQADGFELNDAKTRVMWATERQMIGGLLVNGDEPRPPRELRDRARAAAHGGRDDAATRGLMAYVKQHGGVRRSC
jgi:retron-type reverse transcriptase